MTDLPIKSIEISDASEKYRRCLRKADSSGSKAYNQSIDTNKEAEQALACVLKNLPIDDIPNAEARKLILKLVDSKSSGNSAFNRMIDADEVSKAKALLIKEYGAMPVLASIIGIDTSNYIIKDFKPDRGVFRHAKKININNGWVASWKKEGLNAVPYKNGIKIKGTLLNDCDNFTWIVDKKVPAGEKYLALDVEFSGREGGWGKRAMFALQLNDKYLRPINVGSQSDGMIDRFNGTLYFSIDNLEEIKTLSIKTFAQKEMNLEIRDIRVLSETNKEKVEAPKISCQINQVGYAKNDNKTAILAVSKKDENLKPVSFNLIDQKTGKTVFSGSSSSWRYFQPAGQTYAILDYSSYNKPGDFYITILAQSGISSSITSAKISIKENAQGLLAPVRDASLAAYFYWQCGKESIYNCHAQDKNALVFEGNQKKDVSGGWHDAGDYGKYSVNAAYTLGMLLLGLEAKPEAFSYRVNNPKNNSKMDVFEVIRPEIEWLLKMQRADGAVYHKAASRDWPLNEIDPKADSQLKNIMPISTTATADFAAIMAKAGRMYKSKDPALAKQCLKAAQTAWKFLQKHPELIMLKSAYNGKEYGGPYTDGDDKDERLWAAAELWKATRDVKIHSYLKANLPKNIDATVERPLDCHPRFETIPITPVMMVPV